MSLLSSDMHKLVTAREWWDADIEDLEDILKYAGHGEAGNYEHFSLVMVIHHLRKAREYAQDILGKFDETKGSASLPPTVKERGPFPRKTSLVAGTIPSTLPVRYPYTNNVVDYEVKKKEEAEKAEKLMKSILDATDAVVKEYPDFAMDVEDKMDGALGFLTAQVQARLDPKVRTNTIIEVLEERVAQSGTGRDS